MTFPSPQRILWGGYFLLIVTVIFFGDSLYTFYVYPVVAPIVVLEICSWANSRPYYLSGVAIVIYLTMLVYLSTNWFSPNPEGFLVFGHFFSLPGLIVGSIAFTIFDRADTRAPAASLLLGTVGAGVGFLVAQAVVCNTVMFCDGFSLF